MMRSFRQTPLHAPFWPACRYITREEPDSQYRNNQTWQRMRVRHVQARSGTWKPFGDSPAFANTCHACHTIVKARDFVYTSYAQR